MPSETLIVGDVNLGRALRRLGAAGAPMMGRVLFVEAEKIMAASKRIVPVDTGNLRGTGHVRQPEVGVAAVSVTMAYGGPAAGYAIHVHERLDLRHKPGQHAKFLEFPVMQSARGMETRIAARIAGEVERAAR